MGKKHQEQLPGIIRRKVDRRQKAANEKCRSFFFGLGMFGVVGWTIALPTIVATLFGRWLDRMYPGRISWTLTFLLIGMVTGCLMAWRWITREGGSND